MRQMWIEKKSTGEIWNCLPENPYSTSGGCFFAHPTGLGYEQDISQKQVNVDYIIDHIKTVNQDVVVEAYFNGVEHLENFTKFVGDFEEQFLLYYSPDGSIEPYDMVSKPYYKPIIISKVGRGEMNSAGFIVCDISLKTQSDVWRKDYIYTIERTDSSSLQTLEYPYTYPYRIDGEDFLAISIENSGRETGCVVEVKNVSQDNATNPWWSSTRIIVDKYGNTIEEAQKAKFYVTLTENDTLYVDSNDTTQEAKVIFSDATSESVVSLQEPSWEFINFIRLKHGTNRFVFDVSGKDLSIKIKYAELKEVI